MRLMKALAACVLAASPVLAGPVWAAPVTIQTARGPATVEANPSPVAAYDVAAIDTLEALGVMPAGVPDKLYVSYLDDVAKQARPVGTLFEPDVEALAALGPAAVIVGGRSATQYESLSRLAPVLDMSISPDTLGDARARLEAYGTLFGKEEKAASLAAALDERIAALRAVTKDKGTALIVLTSGPKIAAYGLGSRFGWLHNATGLAEAHPGLKTASHGNAVSFEFIAETDPDWIFVIDRGAAIGQGGSSAAQTLDNPLVATTKAARNGHIVYLNAADMYIAGGGYQATMEILDELHKALAEG